MDGDKANVRGRWTRPLICPQPSLRQWLSCQHLGDGKVSPDCDRSRLEQNRQKVFGFYTASGQHRGGAGFGTRVWQGLSVL